MQCWKTMTAICPQILLESHLHWAPGVMHRKCLLSFSWGIPSSPFHKHEESCLIQLSKTRWNVYALPANSLHPEKGGCGQRGRNRGEVRASTTTTKANQPTRPGNNLSGPSEAMAPVATSCKWQESPSVAGGSVQQPWQPRLRGFGEEHMQAFTPLLQKLFTQPAAASHRCHPTATTTSSSDSLRRLPAECLLDWENRQKDTPARAAWVSSPLQTG